MAGRILRFPVPEPWHGKTVKQVLQEAYGVSHTLLSRLKWREDGILQNGERVFVTAVVHAGDEICLCLPESPVEIFPVPLPFAVVWEDEDLLAVNKPSFMPVYPTPGHDRDSLANAVAFHYQQQGETAGFHPLYRLDRNTSGLLVVGKHAYAASRLAFSIEKEYTALCEGVLTGEGTIRAPIRRKEGARILREVGDGPTSQQAVTHWQAFPVCSAFTLLKIRLETGRTHQIRVHFSHMGHPLLGDDLYGGSRERIGRHALHCSRVRFIHPVTSHPMQWESPLPEDMQAVLE